MPSTSRIFLSHAAKDKLIADALVDLLGTGMSIQSSEVFCTSLEGLGITLGHNFIETVRDELQQPKVVITLLTNNYFESNFCLCELGATWAMFHNLLPILVPPLNYKDISGVLTGVQLTDIQSPTSLTELRDVLLNLLSITNSKTARWEVKRNEFLKKLPNILEQLPKTQKIPFEQFERLRKNYDDSIVALTEAEERINSLSRQIEELKQCKDAEEVKKVTAKYISESEQFEMLVKEAKTNLEKLPSIVPTFIYKLKTGVDEILITPFHDRESYQDAIEASEEDYLQRSANYFSLNLHDPLVQGAFDAIGKLEKFLDKSCSAEFHEYLLNKNNYNISIQNKRFWRDYLYSYLYTI